ATTLTDGKCITFSSNNILEDNTVDNPNNILPKETSVNIDGKVLDTQIAPYTFVVYKFKKNGK
ncbi:MAG: hypothetical protein IJ417_04955, partial [Bacteroidaceae bacterium]|nr:hypothetical protein [Bacteroidaceae bacterium]